MKMPKQPQENPDDAPTLQINTCTGNKAQKWAFTEEGFLRSLLFNDKCASIKKSSLVPLTYPGQDRTVLKHETSPPEIVLKNCDNTSGEKWFIIPFQAGVSMVDPTEIKYTKRWVA